MIPLTVEPEQCSDFYASLRPLSYSDDGSKRAKWLAESAYLALAVRMKFHSCKLRLILSAWTPMFAVGLALAAPPTAKPPTDQPATWVVHDINVNLYNLPRRYSCDELRQKFRDMLLVLGARPDLNVLTSRCELGWRSPSVRVRFSMPEVVEPTAKRGTVVEASALLVRLEPGHPASLEVTDCELMRQIKDGLLAPIPQHVTTFNLACSAPPSRGVRFNLSVQTLQPLAVGTRLADEHEPPLKRLN